MEMDPFADFEGKHKEISLAGVPPAELLPSCLCLECSHVTPVSTSAFGTVKTMACFPKSVGPVYAKGSPKSRNALLTGSKPPTNRSSTISLPLV